MIARLVTLCCILFAAAVARAEDHFTYATPKGGPLAVQQASSAAPSFDCRSATTAREMATCQDVKLAAADRAMAAAWQAAIARLDATTAKALREDQRKYLDGLNNGFDNEVWGKAGAPDAASERRKQVMQLHRGPNDDTPGNYALRLLERQLTERTDFLRAVTAPDAKMPFAGLWKNHDAEILIEPGTMETAGSVPDHKSFRVSFGVHPFDFPKYQCHFAGVFKLSGDAIVAASAYNYDIEQNLTDNLRIRRDGQTVTLDDDVPHQGNKDDPYYICPRIPSLTGPLFHTSLSAEQARRLKAGEED
jgi:uncharacterized protein YecT (DUF1311 family)